MLRFLLLVERPGFDFLSGQEICLYYTAFRWALGLTLPPFQWVPGVPYQDKKRPGYEVEHLHESSVEVKICEVNLYLHFPTLHTGVVLNLLHTSQFSFVTLFLLFHVSECLTPRPMAYSTALLHS
jgi:hypothetical protein